MSSSENKEDTPPEISEVNGNLNHQKPRKEWVKFDDESSQAHTNSESPGVSSTTVDLSAGPAVLNAETVHVSIERGDRNAETSPQSPFKKNVEFVNVRQGFSNGDVIVTLLPVNTKWPWITAAQFRPELVPEELMAQELTLTVEEYVHAMEQLVNDARFTLYNICYKRVLVLWISLAFLVLLALLFSGLTGLTLFSLGVMWLVMNAACIFLCMWIKLKLQKGLERCLAQVNKLLTKHKLIVALDDRGKISCHKVTLCFIYFDSAPCVEHIQRFLDSEEGKTIAAGWETRLDVTATDIVIQGSQATRMARKQDVSLAVYLRYLQRWGKDYLRRRLDWTLEDEGGAGEGNPASPRHLHSALCPCQYSEEVLRNKEPRDPRACCAILTGWLRRRGLD